MYDHKKSLLVLAAAHLLCLACGLWIQDRFLIASAEWASAAQPSVSAEATAAAHPKLTVGNLLESLPSARILALIWIGGLQAVATYLVLTLVRNEASKTEKNSQMQLLRSEKDLVRTRNAVIFGLAKLAEYRDQETGQHLERIALYSTKLTIALRRDPRFRERISPQFAKSIGISAVLHDIGKVAIEDAILRKPGRLEPDERDQMQQHTLVGAECIRQIELRLGNSNFLQMARKIALCHHERWDGSGYPDKVGGEDIPLAARIVAIADIYDALSAKRVYKDAYPHERCVDIIRSEAGKHLDPTIVDVFMKIESEIKDISQRFADSSESINATDPATFLAKQRKPKSAADQRLLNTALDLGAGNEPLVTAS